MYINSEGVFIKIIDAKKQKFTDAPYLPEGKTGFYDGFEPLNDDINTIIEEIKILDNSKKNNKNVWSKL